MYAITEKERNIDGTTIITALKFIAEVLEDGATEVND